MGTLNDENKLQVDEKNRIGRHDKSYHYGNNKKYRQKPKIL